MNSFSTAIFIFEYEVCSTPINCEERGTTVGRCDIAPSPTQIQASARDTDVTDSNGGIELEAHAWLVSRGWRIIKPSGESTLNSPCCQHFPRVPYLSSSSSATLAPLGTLRFSSCRIYLASVLLRAAATIASPGS